MTVCFPRSHRPRGTEKTPSALGGWSLATPRVEVDDEIDRTLLEVYAALSLHTTEEHGGFNSFETH